MALAWEAHLAAARVPGAAHLPVWGIVTSWVVPRMMHRILSPLLLPVLARLAICLSPRGGGAIRRGRDSTPRHGAQDAQARSASVHNTVDRDSRLAINHMCTVRSIPDGPTAYLTFAWPDAGISLVFRQRPDSAILRPPVYAPALAALPSTVQRASPCVTPLPIVSSIRSSIP
jgi:hypothetical protein